MPGIVGVISHRPGKECESLVDAMVASMQHERFYTSATFSVTELGFYAGGVALENSFAAGQPFFDEQRNIALIFSGECFLDPETSAALRRNGHQLKGDKAGWLVQLYEAEGKRCFEQLNGLFSGLLIDKRQKKAFLFNDRYGVERIYWHENNDGLFFASEAKALLRILPELRDFDTEGVAQFLAFGCTLEERTLFREINILPAGSLWSFEGGKCSRQKYFSPEVWEAQPALSSDSFQSEFEQTFKRVLPRYFESESTIGISLTAGLDSRMIMACRPDIAEGSICYTYSSQSQDTLDARLAARLAKVCGLEHKILRVGENFFSDFDSYVDRTVFVTDGYLGVTGAHEIYLNEQARSLAPVRLTGVFGGEVLRGVSMFKPIPLAPQMMAPELAKSLNSFAREGVRDGQHPVTFAAFREIPQKRFGPPAAGRSQLTFRTPYLDNELVALAYRTPESLRSSPLPALSLIRSCNSTLSTIPTDMGEIAERRGLVAASRRIFSKITFKLDYFNNEGLPHWLSGADPLFSRLNSDLGILGLHKFLHYRTWFRQELAPYLTRVLADARGLSGRFWNSSFLENLASEHIGGHKNYIREINAVVTLEAVERLLFKGLPRQNSGIYERSQPTTFSVPQ